jgi:hypothetical protein
MSQSRDFEKEHEEALVECKSAYAAFEDLEHTIWVGRADPARHGELLSRVPAAQARLDASIQRIHEINADWAASTLGSGTP